MFHTVNAPLDFHEQETQIMYILYVSVKESLSFVALKLIFIFIKFHNSFLREA